MSPSSSTSKPPRSRSSIFMSSPPQSSSRSPSTSPKPTLLSKIGSLRRVGSLSSLASSPRTPSPPTTPTNLTTPISLDREFDIVPQDIPRSSSVLSWFSDESDSESKRPWKMPKLKRKNRLSSGKGGLFTFTASAASLSASRPPSPPTLGSPLQLSFGSPFLPAVHPIELDLALDFDCAFPRASDYDESELPSPSSEPSEWISSRPRSSITIQRERRQSLCWYEEEDSVDNRTLYAPSTPEDDGYYLPQYSAIQNSRYSLNRSPSMTEDDDEIPARYRVPDESIDLDLCKQLDAFRILPNAPSLIATPRTPLLDRNASVESLIDPHFDSPSSPSPSSCSSLVETPTPKSFGFNFPMPPSPNHQREKSISFLGFDFNEEDDVDAPFFDCENSS